jgi:hypothetical protein
MSEELEICPDDHHCFNGSKCVENPYSEGDFYCDCDEVVFEARYEGLHCEHKAEVYCVKQGASKHSFCTNGGICQEYIGPEEAYIGCKCPSQYEGPNCQFLKGSKPDGWPFTSNSQIPKQGSPDAGAIIGSLILVIVGAVIGSAFIYKRYYTTGHTAILISQELEMNGNTSNVMDKKEDISPNQIV